MLIVRPILGAIALVALSSSAGAVSISYTDVISSPDYFNGFEDLPSTSSYGATHTEGGITVTQVNGDLNGILTVYNPGGMEGSRSWYPNGGDLGYTQITLESGAEFGNIGFLVGSGWAVPGALAYSLFNNGIEIASGILPQSREFSYLSFIGGGFDTLFLRDSISSSGFSMFDGSINALALDSIEATVVPLPASLPLFASALGLFGLLRLFRRKAALEA